MALYHQNGIYGVGGLSMTGIGTTEKYAGQETGIKASSSIKGLDIGKAVGILRGQYVIRINRTGKDKLAWSGDTVPTVTMTVYCSDTDGSGYKEKVAVKVTAEEINESRYKSLEIGLPITFGQYSVIGLKSDVALTAGEIVVTVEKPSWG